MQATEIVDVKVTYAIKIFFEKDGHGLGEDPFPMHMKFIHLYLHDKPDLLFKKFIFFPMNEGSNHWNGWAAVNPWAQLARVLYERAKKHSKENKREFSFCCGYRKLANGLISCDGLSTKGTVDSSSGF